MMVTLDKYEDNVCCKSDPSKFFYALFLFLYFLCLVVNLFSWVLIFNSGFVQVLVRPAVMEALYWCHKNVQLRPQTTKLKVPVLLKGYKRKLDPGSDEEPPENPYKRDV
jgi:hypothetical protein